MKRLLCILWLYLVAYKKEWTDGIQKMPAYYSKFDDSYITFVGLESDMWFLVKRGIIKNLTHGVGYSPLQRKWYGWSHRAICGFTIGSQVKKGDCAYNPITRDDYIESILSFWEDEIHEKTWVEEILDTEFHIMWQYNNEVPNEKLRGTCNGIRYEFPEQYGRGEWTAKTMNDARQMAIDFNHGVS